MATKRKGGCEVLRLKKGVRGKSFSRGSTKRFGVVLTQVLEALTILVGGGHKYFPPLKRDV